MGWTHKLSFCLLVFRQTTPPPPPKVCPEVFQIIKMAAYRTTAGRSQERGTGKMGNGDARGKTETWPETQNSHMASETVLKGNGTST